MDRIFSTTARRSRLREPMRRRPTAAAAPIAAAVLVAVVVVVVVQFAAAAAAAVPVALTTAAAKTLATAFCGNGCHRRRRRRHLGGKQQPRQRLPARHLLYATNGNGNAVDSKGAAVLIQDLDVYRGPQKILSEVDWRIEPRTKWALVGENGAGKSTLLEAIVGELPCDSGTVVVGATATKEKNNGIGYLQQTSVAGSNRTVFDEAASGMTAVNRAREEMEEAERREDLDALQRAATKFDAVGGYQQEQKVASALRGLGFGGDFEQWKTRRCDELSGGWQMRVSFAKLLLSEPALCLMDEPGNHLDAAAKKWLARYLAEYDGEGAMVLVTHDVELLKSMDHIAELVPKSKRSLQVYKSCTYDQYLDLKRERAATAAAEYERNAAKAAKLQAFVDRFGASATKASAAQSRVKQLEKMRRDGLLDEPTTSSDEIIAAQERFKPSLKLPDPPRAVGNVLLSLNENARVGYQQKPLVSGINLDITKGMKLLIRGPNGAGKSTVLHALRGSLELIDGVRVENPSLRLGMFTQDLAQELDPDMRAVDVVTEYARNGLDGDITVSDQDARTAMGRLGLRGDKPLRYIRDLSGGEKARVALAMFSLKPSNLYLFDEASNHLDAEWYAKLCRKFSRLKTLCCLFSYSPSSCDQC